jgi:ATP-dependent protease ClpP protease subunit
MPSWNELVEEFQKLPDDQQRSTWLRDKQTETLKSISSLRGDSNVVFYTSAFLQKPGAPPPTIQITSEDLNGFMSVIFGMNWSKPLTLLLHTPGGVTNAAETIVEYIRSKFAEVEVVVPTYAMSAGTMIALSSNRIVMGRQSQLGPIDPQLVISGTMVSARAIVDQFEKAKAEILGDVKAGIPGDVRAAHAWAPVLQSLGPALLVQAQYALQYGEEMVGKWLASYMLAGKPDRATLGPQIANHFNDAGKHKSHGRRIGREEARQQGVTIEDMEADQRLQDLVLTAYHIATISFERSVATKVLATHTGRSWMKAWGPT